MSYSLTGNGQISFSPYAISGEVKCYPYRTAMVGDHFLKLPRMGKELSEFEEKLAAAAGVRTDNHTVYRINNGDSTVYVFFHDLVVIFGFSVDECRW